MLGAPDVLAEAGALELPAALQRGLEEHTAAGRRVVAFGRATALPGDPAAQPPPRLTPLALVVLEETLRPDAAETIAFMREQEVDLKLISGDARPDRDRGGEGGRHARGRRRDRGPAAAQRRARPGPAAERNTIFCRIRPEQKNALVGALSDAGRYTAMIGDGVNDVPALKRARLAVAMGSGSQITKGVADIVLLEDEFSRLPRAVAEGRRIARNIHRLGRLYLTKTVYAALIVLVAVPGFAFPFLPRHLTLAALLTIGIPSFVLALAPSDGPLYRGRLLRALAAFAVPAGPGDRGRLAGLLLPRRHRVRRLAGSGPHRGDDDAGRPRASASSCCSSAGPGREHIAIQSYMLALIAGLGALYALFLAAAPVRDFFDLTLLKAGQWFLALLSAAAGLVLAHSPGACLRSSSSRRPTCRPLRRPGADPHAPYRRRAGGQRGGPEPGRDRAAQTHEDRRHDRPGDAARWS